MSVVICSSRRRCLDSPDLFVIQVISNMGDSVFLKLWASYRSCFCDRINDIREFHDYFAMNAKDLVWGNRAQLWKKCSSIPLPKHILYLCMWEQFLKHSAVFWRCGTKERIALLRRRQLLCYFSCSCQCGLSKCCSYLHHKHIGSHVKQCSCSQSEGSGRMVICVFIVSNIFTGLAALVIMRFCQCFWPDKTNSIVMNMSGKTASFFLSLWN